MNALGWLQRLGGAGALGLGCCVVPAGAAGFDTAAVGVAPPDWTCGSTGGGAPRWTVEEEATPAGPRRVLKQGGHGRFPWCVKDDTALADGWVQVRFKPVAGKEDQAGGLVWRWKNGDNYYVARANALENNVSLYLTQGGNRRTIVYRDAPVPANTWHVLRVEFHGPRLRVLLDGTQFIEAVDDRLAGPGKLGVWTKADSVTLFDDFAYGPR